MHVLGGTWLGRASSQRATVCGGHAACTDRASARETEESQAQEDQSGPQQSMPRDKEAEGRGEGKEAGGRGEGTWAPGVCLLLVAGDRGVGDQIRFLAPDLTDTDRETDRDTDRDTPQVTPRPTAGKDSMCVGAGGNGREEKRE
eukprot:1983311-Rhodomonas_salina.1